jgi:predicted alpha/beta hydrolase
MSRQTRHTLPKVEQEVRALGRSFGSHSMGLGGKREKD